MTGEFRARVAALAPGAPFGVRPFALVVDADGGLWLPASTWVSVGRLEAGELPAVRTEVGVVVTGSLDAPSTTVMDPTAWPLLPVAAGP